MRRIITSMAILLGFTQAIEAQEMCGFDTRHKQMMKADPAYRQNVLKMKQDWVEYNRMKESARLVITGTDTLYEIPLVIHVVHTGGPVGSQYNPSDQQLEDLVDYVNQTYQAMWANYPGPNAGGTRIPFQVVLAKRDPNCQPTNGILRVDGSVLPGYVSGGIGAGGAAEIDVKALSVWPNDRYYNVWVVHKIDDPGVAGYAYYPGAGPAVDGTVMLASVAQAGSSTLVHEMGHGMGLPHTFEGDNGGADCPPNVDCLVDGDGICDTEPHKRGVSCNDVTNLCTSQPLNNTQFSFMSYTGGCRDRFTPGQRDKVMWNLKNNRASLMMSDGGVPAPGSAIAAQCVPTSLNPGSTANVGPQVVTFNNFSRASGGFDTEGVHVDNFCTHYTELFLGNSYPISVTTGNQAENVRVFIDYNNDGQFQNPAELVYNSGGTLPGQTHTGTINIPATGPVICTPLRMRVISDVISAAPPAPCGPLTMGQAEDYVVTIKPATGAALASTVTSTFPGCQDSLLSFLATPTNLPTGSTISWTVNGQEVATGTTFSASNLQSGDVVTVVTTVMNPTCNTPDSIKSNSFTVNFLPGPTPPFISFINGDLVSNVAPVQWYGPSGIIPGATNQSYHPTEPGQHYAVVVASPCPSIKSNLLDVTLLSVGEYSFENMKIYPNPVREELVIDWGTETQDVKIELLNTLGQTLLRTAVKNEHRKVIPMSQYANGIYFVKVTGDGGKAGLVRILVQH